jgi:uncharacterized protein (DUF433 family)
LTDYLEGGGSLAEFLEQYPSVTREAAIAALEEARSSPDYIEPVAAQIMHERAWQLSLL